MYYISMSRLKATSVATVKDKAARAELVRAHTIIAMLSLGLIALLVLGSMEQLSAYPWIVTGTIVLLGAVTILSLSVVIALLQPKKRRK